MSDYRLTRAEQSHFLEQGFLLRENVFSAEEVSDIGMECEALVDRLIRHRKGERITFGSYTFDADLANDTVIKWEGDSEIVHGIEPFAHLSPKLEKWALDPRFIDPMKDMIGSENPALFTEKLNLKRPKHGGPNPMHQDHPYWVSVAEVASDVYTAMLFLDDASVENGCLQVVPGSHTQGEWIKRSDGDRFAGNEIDVSKYPEVTPQPVEVRAGAVIFFGALLVHQSAPNISDQQRRAILYSYQPPGRRSQMDAFKASWKSAR
jgi:phytanoyl-CoA hydroxylase